MVTTANKKQLTFDHTCLKFKLVKRIGSAVSDTSARAGTYGRAMSSTASNH